MQITFQSCKLHFSNVNYISALQITFQQCKLHFSKQIGILLMKISISVMQSANQHFYNANQHFYNANQHFYNANQHFYNANQHFYNANQHFCNAISISVLILPRPWRLSQLVIDYSSTCLKVFHSIKVSLLLDLLCHESSRSMK
jgi:hypothetical protein